MSLIVIRPLLKSEIKLAAQLWLEASIKAHPFVDSAFWITNVKNMETLWLPKSDNYALHKDNQLLGFSSLLGERIAAIFLKPIEQGKGYGSLLVNHLKQYRKRLELSVYEKNTSAISFYMKHGFEIVSKQLDMATGENEYSMIWLS